MSRKAFGKEVVRHSVWQERIADARINIEMTRLLTLKAGNDNKEFYEKIINNNFDNPEKISDYVFKNMLRKSSEKNVLIFNHPEFLKA